MNTSSLTESIEALKNTPGTCSEAQQLIEAARKVATGETTLEQVIADTLAPECGLPPPGWKCTRKAGHDGPCATIQLLLNDEPWIGVDLDATLAHYDDWLGIDHIGPPIPAMQTRVKQWLSEGKHVRILTARVGPHRHDMPHTIEEITHHIEQWCLQHLGQVLPVTCAKDYNMTEFYDDRCIQVIPNTGRILEDEQWDTNAWNFRLRQALQHYATADFLTTEQKMRAEYALAHHPAPVISLEQHEAAIADLNERLIDRTTGFMLTLGQQALELNHLRTELRQEKEILSAFTDPLSTPPSDQWVPSATFISVLRQRDKAQANAQLWAEEGTKATLEAEAHLQQIDLMRKHDEQRLDECMIIGSCNCLTKTPEVQHHKPGCKYRLISERDEARHETAYCRQKIDELNREIGMAKHSDLGYAAIAEQRDNAQTALQQAYVHNQNMHCFVTKGRLNDQLNEQTHLLRKALGIPGAQPPEAAPVPYAADDAPCDSCLAGGICDGPDTAHHLADNLDRDDDEG